MISFAQLVISLFTVGGRPNPLALMIFAATLFLGYQYWSLKSEHYELLRQSEVVQDASKDKVQTLNEARNEQAEAAKVIDSGDFNNDYLKRLQQSN